MDHGRRKPGPCSVLSCTDVFLTGRPLHSYLSPFVPITVNELSNSSVREMGRAKVIGLRDRLLGSRVSSLCPRRNPHDRVELWGQSRAQHRAVQNGGTAFAL